jgi:hypothetical protein
MISCPKLSPRLPLVLSLLASLWFAGCAGGGADDRVKCVSTNQCGVDESCEEGFCRPACTPGVDCPVKDQGDGDGAPIDGDDIIEGDDSNDGDAGTDLTDGEDGDSGPGNDATDPDAPLVCGVERMITSHNQGRGFEVHFGDVSSGVIAVPVGWTLDEVCCTSGCCQ